MARPRKKRGKKLYKGIYIFCEGEKTEPNYFNSLIRSLNFPGELAVVKVVETEHTDLVGLVREAKKFKAQNEYKVPGDEYWIVVDKDGYTEHAKGFDQAKSNSINIAFSSICFEYWIYCHFGYSTAAYAKCKTLITALKRFIPQYTKNNTNIFALTSDKLEDAIKHAKQCRKHWSDVNENKRIYDLTPYTDVDKLISCLRQYIKEIKGK